MFAGNSITSFIIRAESALEDEEQLSAEEWVDGVAELVKSGVIVHLQGSWQRCAAKLIELGYIDAQGNVLGYPDDED
jgi:hypothetical protein